MEAMTRREGLPPEWIATVAHDLRAPITIIRGYAQWLERLELESQREPTGQLQTMRCIKAILESSHQLNRLVSDLAEMARLEVQHFALQPREVDLTSLIRDIVDRSSALVEDHPLRVTGAVEPMVARVDPDRVEQILANLLSNGAKYGYQGTELQVGLAEHEGAMQVSVSNEGPGIPSAHLPELFNLFHRTPQARAGAVPGLGLGLYICKALVEAHGGRIWIDSTPDATTTVAFTLPLVPGGRQRPS